MSKKIAITWAAVLLVAIALTMVNSLLVENVRHRDAKSFWAELVEDWAVSYESEPDENGLYYIRYVNVLDKIQKGGEVLMFYAYHGDVYAYADGDVLYSLYLEKEKTMFETVSGDTWNCFLVPEEYEGKEIEVVIETKYASYLKYVPDFYLGDRLNIVRDELKRSAVSLLLCIAIFVVGIVVLVYCWLTSKNNYDNYDMVYLGIFALMLSVWFIINMPVVNMVTDIGTILTYMSYILLGAIPVPLILFEKRMVADEYRRKCDILCKIVIVVQVVSVLLQVMSIKDMKESLMLTHMALGISIAGLLVILIMNVKTTGFQNLTIMSKINILGGMVTSGGVAMDILYFYIDANKGKNYDFTKAALFIYTVALCFNGIRETGNLMQKGRDAQKYENMAYRDELTGMFNRMACNNDMRDANVRKYAYTVFMFDLNNLKQCNDTLGHNAGDDYIIKSASYIQDAFQNIGKCYRIGGDEFCVIGKNIENELVKQAYHRLDVLVDGYNKDNPSVHMSIAHGHKTYNASLDEDLKDTRGRADKEMYKNKVAMKAHGDT